jgi:hypothetical protein
MINYYHKQYYQIQAIASLAENREVGDGSVGNLSSGGEQDYSFSITSYL